MRKKQLLIQSSVLLAIIALMGTFNLPTVPIPVLAQTTEETLANEVYQQVNPAFVTIKTNNGHGSGFIVNKEGLIITNAHVLQNAPRVVTVIFNNGRQVSADVIGFAKDGLDLAALRIYNENNLKTLTLAQNSSFKVGDRVFAMGTPIDIAYKGSFTSGNITRLDPQIIQHDAVLMGGNSGGPLLNSKGQVIGVNFSGFVNPISKTNTGMNFAIPVIKLEGFLRDIEKGNISPVSTLPHQEQSPSIVTLDLKNQVIKGTLGKGDQATDKGDYVDIYQFRAKAGQKVMINMSSQDINSVLILYQLEKLKLEDGEEPTLKQIAQNDDQGAGNFNAQITFTVAEEGFYILYCTSSDSGESGSYQLQISLP